MEKGDHWKVIIIAAFAGAATFKNNNPAVPYTPDEFAMAAHKAYKAGANCSPILIAELQTDWRY